MDLFHVGPFTHIEIGLKNHLNAMNVCVKVSDATIDSDSRKEHHLPTAMKWSIILFVLILIVLTPPPQPEHHPHWLGRPYVRYGQKNAAVAWLTLKKVSMDVCVSGRHLQVVADDVLLFYDRLAEVVGLCCTGFGRMSCAGWQLTDPFFDFYRCVSDGISRLESKN